MLDVTVRLGGERCSCESAHCCGLEGGETLCHLCLSAICRCSSLYMMLLPSSIIFSRDYNCTSEYEMYMGGHKYGLTFNCMSESSRDILRRRSRSDCAYKPVHRQHII